MNMPLTFPTKPQPRCPDCQTFLRNGTCDHCTGLAFTSGVIASTHAILAAVRSGDRSLARTFHQFEPGSANEAAFDDGCQFAATKMLGGAEFALQVRSDRQPANPPTN